jgi:hypothetical protein
MTDIVVSCPACFAWQKVRTSGSGKRWRNEHVRQCDAFARLPRHPYHREYVHEAFNPVPLDTDLSHDVMDEDD